MCPACMAATALMIASAVTTGGAAALVVNKIRAAGRAENAKDRKAKEEPWEQHTSK